MDFFLDAIARSLYEEFGNTLNRHCIVFPNRRAGLFFKKYLSSHIVKPVWEPEIFTINELFRHHSGLQLAGNELLLIELYKIYRKYRKSAESFDSFIYWGDMLLNDFDDTDKYLADASHLFRSVKDLKNIDNEFESLSGRQKEIVRSFWTNFNPDKPTDQKNGFISIWSVLYEIYSDFRETLRRNNLAYEGMIFRDLTEDDKELFSTGKQWDLIHFVGFNALNECERKIMLRLKKMELARFYWDYDESYLKVQGYNSAGFFLRDNVRILGNNMPESWSYKTLLSDGSTKARRRLIETSSDIEQVKLLPGLLRNLPGKVKETAHETAIVLADENLLIPVLSTLPPDNGDINITMGFPLAATNIYSLLRKIMDLQQESTVADGKSCFGFPGVEALLSDKIINELLCPGAALVLEEIKAANILIVPEDRFPGDENYKILFSKKQKASELSEYFRKVLTIIAVNGNRNLDSTGENTIFDKITNEFIYRSILAINRLESVIRTAALEFSEKTYLIILDRILRKQSVPFAGEPLSGIQIMGILETRALDFRNLIVLSVNEGVIPSVSSPASSYIPFSLREAFGLPSVNHQESVFAYHFYRLLQRSENVVFIYNSNPDGLRTGEMSRFLTQMMYDKELKPDISKVLTGIRTTGGIAGELQKSADHINILRSQFVSGDSKKSLSPSAINIWLNCRMKFYYRYVCGLREPEDLKIEIDAALLGEILHEVMFEIYSPFQGKAVDRGFIEALIADAGKIRQTISAALSKKLKKQESDLVHGNEIIAADVIFNYIQRILRADSAFAPFSIKGLEKAVVAEFAVSDGTSGYHIRIGGVIDRIDALGGITRIVDYKTGSVADSVSSIMALFEDDRKKEYDGWLQTLLYCELFNNKPEAGKIRPSVYRIRKAGDGISEDRLMIKPDRKTEIPLDNYFDVRNEFIDGLREVTNLIFSENEPFRMTKDRNQKCRFCYYRKLCMR